MPLPTQQQNFLLGIKSANLYSRPSTNSARTDYYAEQEAEMGWAVDQAVTRGLIDQREAEEAKVANERTWWDRTWGFKESSGNLTGRFSQGIVDVLSLGNYAAAATTKATIEDPLVQIGSLKLGFTPSAWLKNFQERPYYSDMFESFWGGLAFDIALDPLTYLTFGVGAGTKVGVQGLARVGSKVLPKGTSKLTLTRHGQEIYNLAARKFRPLVEESIQKSNADKIAAGQRPDRLVDEQFLHRFHDMIGKNMVDNYETLALEYSQQMGRWDRFKAGVAGAVTTPGDNILRGINQEAAPHLSKTAEDMFRETARFQHKDFGLDFTRVGRKLAAAPVVGQAFKAVAPNFHRKWNVPVDVQDRWFLTKNSIESQTAQRTNEVNEALGHLDPEELKLVTRIIDDGEGSISRNWNEEQKTVMNVLTKDGSYVSDRVMDAVDWSKQRFEEIAKREDEAGFKIERLQDYVMRVFKTRDARQLMLSKVKANEGINDFSKLKGFQMHRTIASLDEVTESMGEGAIEQNIGAIIQRRESASVRMMEMEKFYDYIKTTSGIAPLMVYQAGNDGRRVSSMLKKILRSQRPSENRIYDFDQVFSMDDAIHKKLGFISDSKAFASGGANRNLDLLRYLSLDMEDRIGDAGAALTSKIRPNGRAQVAQTFSNTFKYKGKEVDFTTLLDAEYNSDVLGLVTWVGSNTKGGIDRLNSGDVTSLLRSLDRHTRKELDTPLLMLFPDIIDRVRKEMVNVSKLSKKVPATQGGKPGDRVLKSKFENQLKNLEHGKDGLRRQVATFGSFVPQLPEEFVLRANISRMRYGDMTDVSKIAPVQAKKIKRLSKKIGLKGDHLIDVTKALVNVDSLGGLSGRQADKVIEFLGVHAGEYTARNGAVSGSLFPGGVRKVTFSQRAKMHFDSIDPTVKSSIEDAEKMALNELQRKTKMERFDRQIKSGKEIVKKYNGMLATLYKQSEGLTNQKEVGVLADEILRLETLVAKATRMVDSASTRKKDIRNPIHTPEPTPDQRQYIGMKEIADRNADVMSAKEIKSISARAGVSRNTKDIRRLFSKDDLAPAFEARRVMSKKLKELEAKRKTLESARDRVIDSAGEPTKAEMKELSIARRAIAKLTDDGVGGEQLAKATERLNKINAKINKKAQSSKNLKFFQEAVTKVDEDIQKVMNDVAAKFDNGYRILGGGRYMDDTGKVRDIIFRKTKDGKKLTIIGKNADKVKQALIGDMIRKGRNEVEFLKPALKNELPDSILGAAADSYYLPEDVARFLEDVVTPLYNPASDEMVNGLLRGYDRIQNLFKVPLLAPWFSTMARNFVGNVSINYLRAGVSLLDPEHLTDFAKTLNYTWAKESPVYRKAVGFVGQDDKKISKLGQQVVKALGDEGESVTVAELADELGKRGVFTSWMRDEVFDTGIETQYSRLFGGAAGAGIGGSIAGPAGGAVGALIGAKLGKEAYRMRYPFRFQELASELPTRLMLGIHAYKATGSFDEAGRVVRHFLHDYNELSTFERRVIRRMIPFYNFTKLATRVIGTQLFEQPGRVMLPHKIFNSQNLTGAMFDTPAMPEDVPDWFHKQMVFMGKDIDEETGEVKTHVYSGFNLPVQEVFQLADIVAPGGEPITQLGSRGSFLATSVLEYVMNYDTFRGGPIYPDVEAGIKQTPWESGTSFKNSPGWMKKLVGYQEGDDGKPRVNPKLAWALGAVPTSRFFNLSKKIYEMDEEEAQQLNYSHLASQVLGVNAYRYDPEQQRFFVNRRRVNAMTNVLANIQALKSYDIDRSTFGRPDRRRKTTTNTPSGLVGLAGQGPL